MNRGLSEALPSARRWPAFAAAFWMLLGTLLLAFPARGGSIFDDNWTPPKAAKPAEPPPVAAPNKPAKPPEGARPDTQNTPPTEVTPTPTVAAPPARRPVPAAADQAKSRKLFKEVFATELADRSAAARRALAAKLLAQAATVSDAPSDQFVLLVGAGEAGMEAHDLGLICKAADALGETYDVDTLHVKSDNALKMTFRADTPAATTENCRLGLKLVEQLVAADDYATAARLLYVLRAASSDADLSTQIQTRAKEVDSLRTAAERVAPYLQKLRTSPDDPSANLMVGQYLCFIKDDWKRGLPLLLAKGGKTSESAAAALDLAGASDPKKQIAIGDAWWDVAEQEPASTQLALRQRATSWYRAALDSGTITGLTRVLLDKRIATAPPKAAPPSAMVGRNASRKVLWFRGDGLEEPIVQGISGGDCKAVSKPDAAAALADPNLYTGVGVMVWGNNRWRETPREALTDAAQQHLERFVREGGDLLMFYQFGADHMEIIAKLFGVKTTGGSGGAQIVLPELQARAAQAGYTENTLKKINFFNSYSNVPKDATVLVRDGAGHDAIVIVPFGKGRLILIGTGMGSNPHKLVEEISDLIYHWRVTGAR